MEPEIARRCKSCGAAIRARSAYCPQCGVAQAAAHTQPAPSSASSAAPPETSQHQTTDSRPGAETISSATQAEIPLQTEAAVKTETAAPENARGRDAASPETPPSIGNQPHTVAAIAPGAGPADAASEKRQQRVTVAAAPNNVARGVADDGVRHRADKLRRASNVVLDEAAADPSLRFVLVATALIIISLLLLLLARIL